MTYLDQSHRQPPTGIKKILHLNWGLALLLIAVSCAGFLMLFSVAGGSMRPWAQPQLTRFAMGFAVMLVVAMVPIRHWRSIAPIAYLGAFALLVLVELIGTTGKGAQRWIDLGFMQLQPSEVMKIALVMVLALYYDWLSPERVSRPFWVLLPLVLILAPTALVLKQPDLGTSILLIAGGGVMMFAAGVSWWYFAAAFGTVAGAVTLVFETRGTPWQVIKDYQYRRIDHLPEPRERPAGRRLSHHAVQNRTGLWRRVRARLHGRHAEPSELPAGEAH